jgi:hypothetical protein
MVPSYVQKILEWPLPANRKELKQFLGFIGYYRGFIPDIAELTFEMNDMKKGNKLQWNDKVIAKFETLKKRFAAAPLRRYPDYTTQKPFILDTDFSSTAMAAILSQEQDGEERFIGAGARKCNKAEQNNLLMRENWQPPSWVYGSLNISCGSNRSYYEPTADVCNSWIPSRK